MRFERVAWAGALALLLASCGGDDSGGGTATPSPPISITSGATGTLAENATDIAYRTTVAGGSGMPTFSLSGVDAAAFTINANGEITFRTPPNFEAPTDRDVDNMYVVTVRATDATGEATRDVTITVTNVADITAVDQIGNAYIQASHIAPVPGQTRIFVAQRNGEILLVDPAIRERGTLYMSIPDLVTSPGRRGLMSMVAAPDFATSGTIYAYVAVAGAIEVRRYGRTAAGFGDLASADVIFRVALPSNSVDVGGWLGLTDDGLLYITTGSGGTRPSNTSLLGKVLRVDPTRDAFPDDPLRDYAIPSNAFNSPGPSTEIYAASFNDPWRAAVAGNDLYLVDQNNTAMPGSTPLFRISFPDGGMIYADDGDGPGFPPVLRAGQTSTGAGFLVPGGVYRGPSPDLVRQFLFYVSAGLPSMSYSGIYSTPAAGLMSSLGRDTRDCCTFFSGRSAVAFGEDQSRNLYFTDGSALFAIRYR